MAINLERFPIMAWGSAPGNLDVLREMAECRINIAGFVSPEHLDAVEEAGLKAFVMDQRASGYDFRNLNEEVMRQRVASLVDEVGSHPASIGYFIKDEPHAEEFAGLAKVTKAFLEMDSTKIPYINLYPNYASQQQLGTETYWEHVERFMTTVNPPIISYDHYAIMERQPLREGYFANLELIRWASIKYQRPFWNVILSTAHFNYREPTEADIRFQVFTTLAYGGKGISYFTYFAPLSGNCRMSPIDHFGRKTITWSYLQRVNSMVEMLGPTLMELTSLGVYHVGKVPQGCSGLPGNTIVRAVHSDGDLVVGEFVHRDGSNYVMVVNKDFQYSTHFRLTLNDPGHSLQRVSSFSGRFEDLVDNGDWLAPGQGVLLCVVQKEYKV